MTSNSQDNETQDDQVQNDQVLSQLYKEGAKDTPPAKLNSEILNYAANANKSASESNHIGSHFGGGWKVPLSLAASVVVVFALLVQLDQSPQQLELPPIPEIPTSTSKDKLGDSPKPDIDITESKNDALKSQSAFEEMNEAEGLTQGSSQILKKPDEKKQSLKKRETGGSLQDSISSDAHRLEEKTNKPASSTINENIINSPSTEGYEPEIDRDSAIENSAQESVDTSGNSSVNRSKNAIRQESLQKESAIRHDKTLESSDMAADSETESHPAAAGKPMQKQAPEQEFAPIPVEDWLLIIEKLVAQKDYAEAARQLQKFKQAHPKVNVEDLDAKIP